MSGTSACGAEAPRVEKSVPSHVRRKHDVILEVSSGMSGTGNLSTDTWSTWVWKLVSEGGVQNARR